MTSSERLATPALSRLSRFVGVWDTAGEVLMGGSRIPFRATDEYEWLRGGFFLLHRFSAAMPDGEISGIEVIGQIGDGNTYSMISFDSTGSSAFMTAHEEGERWIFAGERARFSGAFSDDGRRFTGRWETASESSSGWEPWMTVSLVKRVPAPPA